MKPNKVLCCMFLVHGHMTSYDESVSRQILWIGNITKTMTSNGKQFTATREMMTAVACDRRWPDVVAGISASFFKICFCFVLVYNKSLNDWSLREQWLFFLESQCFPRRTSRSSGNKKFTVPFRGQSLSVKYLPNVTVFPRPSETKSPKTLKASWENWQFLQKGT